eukprot:scaffold13023_cov22-Tisochrysis_lutea.AAC.2
MKPNRHAYESPSPNTHAYETERPTAHVHLLYAWHCFAGTRRIRIPTVLSAADTEEMEHMYTEALVRVGLSRSEVAGPGWMEIMPCME